MSELYYKLPEDKRWLGDGNTPDGIGGRATDIEVIGMSLYQAIRDAYPINKVPRELLVKAEDLQIYLERGSRLIQQLIDAVSIDIRPEVMGDVRPDDL